MSKYTTEVRFYCESLAGYTESQDYSKIDSIVATAAPMIFGNFPIWDEKYRLTLETKILKHYYMREICAETPALWKLWLNNRLNEIMPYYNKLYESAQLEFNPFTDVDYTVDHSGSDNKKRNKTSEDNSKLKSDSSQDTNSTNTVKHDEKRTAESDLTNTYTNENEELYANTPQGSVDGPTFSQYLTDAKKIDGSGNSHDTNNSTEEINFSDDTEIMGTVTNANNQTINNDSSEDETIDSTDKYIDHISGKQGNISYSKLLMEYRETLLNIDLMIINDLADLFFNLY